MDDGVHTLHGLMDRRRVGQVEDPRLLVRLKVRDRADVGQAQFAAQGRKAAAQLGAKPAGRAGDQDRVKGRGSHAGTFAGSSAATARARRAMATASTASEVVVEMRKKDDSPWADPGTDLTWPSDSR